MIPVQVSNAQGADRMPAVTSGQGVMSHLSGLCYPATSPATALHSSFGWRPCPRPCAGAEGSQGMSPAPALQEPLAHGEVGRDMNREYRLSVRPEMQGVWALTQGSYKLEGGGVLH